MLNEVSLQGRFTKDPELETTKNGTSVLHFTLAVDRSFKNQNGERDTDFIYIVAFSRTAEFISKYFHKGDMIVIHGSLHTSSWKDENGNYKTSYDVVANQVNFAGSKKDGQTKNNNAYENAHAATAAANSGVVDDINDSDDDLPF